MNVNEYGELKKCLLSKGDKSGDKREVLKQVRF